MAHKITDSSNQEVETNLTAVDFLLLSKEGPEDDAEVVSASLEAIRKAAVELQDFISRAAKVNAFIIIAAGETEENAEGHSQNALLQACFGTGLAAHTLLRYLIKRNSELSETPIAVLEERYNFIGAIINQAIEEVSGAEDE
jgi:hypothetical protein